MFIEAVLRVIVETEAEWLLSINIITYYIIDSNTLQSGEMAHIGR